MVVVAGDEAAVLGLDEAAEVTVVDSVVGLPSELVVVWAETHDVALLAASEPRDWPSDAMEEANEAASPVSVERAPAPPVRNASAMEVASAPRPEPRDSPPAEALE